MEPIGLAATTRDFYDRVNGPSRSFLRLGGLLLFIAFMFTSVWWSSDKFFLLLCCLVAPTMLLALPRLVRNVLLAYRGAPALRISEQGIWSRQWASLGWISWRDIASVETISGLTRHELVIHLNNNEFARLAGHDQASIMLARLTGCLFFNDAGPNTLRLTNSSELTSSWEGLMTTLDPILAANSVVMLKKTNSV